MVNAQGTQFLSLSPRPRSKQLRSWLERGLLAITLTTLIYLGTTVVLSSTQALLSGQPLEKAIPVFEAPIAELGKALGRSLSIWIPEEWAVPTPLGTLDVRFTVSYTIYEWFKLPVLLYLTTFAMTLIRLSISTERLERTLGRGDLLGILGGVLLGMVTPVCSCTVTNLYAGLIAGGAHRRAAAAFLFASPAMNEFAIAFMLITTGLPGMLLYLIAGITAAAIVALLAEIAHIAPKPSVFQSPTCKSAAINMPRSLLLQAQSEALQLLRRLLFAVLISGALAAVLTNFNLTLVAALRQAGYAWWGPLAAALLGLPLDVNAASTAPILFALREIVPLGTLISAMMATTVASIPEGSMLVRIMGWRPTLTLAMFYAAYTASIGLIINAVLA